MASDIENGNKESPTEFGNEYLKIVVIGKPGCGKTTFIRACIQNGEAQPETSINGVKVYPGVFEFVGGEFDHVALYEIPGEDDVPISLKKPHYEKAKIFIFMYAIDDPSSFEMLFSKWLPETNPFRNLIYDPVALVGNKLDLRNNQEVIASLALNNQVPVTTEQNVGFLDPMFRDHLQLKFRLIIRVKFWNHLQTFVICIMTVCICDLMSFRSQYYNAFAK